MAALPVPLANALQGFNEMPMGRRVALVGMVVGGLVAMIAIMAWSLRPTYAPLFARIDSNEAASIMEALNGMGVPYRVDNVSGQITIPRERIAETRLQLAGQGLPKSPDVGFELLAENPGFGTSRLIEGARYQRALEGELGRSISALDPVESARVHLAQPERSVFVRERTPPSASVVVHLRGGRGLTDEQVGAIVHLVSSSVAELEPERVTVVDQTGRLLTGKDDRDGAQMATDQLDYTRRVEAGYAERVRDLLTPVVGRDRVRVQVAADLDFSRVERTQELYDPDKTAVRSEQTSEKENIGTDPLNGGVPGALTNQPPQGGVIGQQNAPAQNNNLVPSSRAQEAVRNYEIDRTIAHIREMPGGVKRLSTAVVVDYQDSTSPEGEPIRAPRADAEMDKIRALVREAVGFSEARGDTLNVSTVSFVPDALDEEPIPFWTETWFIELMKIAGGFILALLVLLMIVRPAFRQIFAKPEPEPLPEEEDAAALTDQTGEAIDEDGDEALATLTHDGKPRDGLAALTGPDQQQLDLDAIRDMIKDDPKKVVQVVKSWLAEDGN